MKRIAPIVAVACVLLLALAIYRGGAGDDAHYTGFVEGEERVLRSEVSGRVIEVAYREGDAVEAGAVVARLDDADLRARLASKRREIEALERSVERAEIEVELRDETWAEERSASEAELRRAVADLELAERTAKREEGLAARGAATTQSLDEARARLVAAQSARDRASHMLERTKAEEASVAAARAAAEVLRAQRALAESQLAELEVTHAKFAIRAPDVATVVQTQLLWPGELAQPGTPILSVLDPNDKYVQIYVPVPDLERFRVGARVRIELDSAPGRRFAGEVSFVADRASFTPEKIETRADRVGQVYRAKVRILEDPSAFAPGAEGDVYPAPDSAER